MDVQVSDFITIGLLVLLEGLLSADNALVLAMMILGCPGRIRKRPCATAWLARSRSAPRPRCWRRG